MTEWISIGDAADFPQGSQQCVKVNDLHLLIFHVDEQWYAMKNECPHAQRPLDQGERKGLTITCPYHGYTFRLKDGVDVDAPDWGTPATVYPVRKFEGRVEIQTTPLTHES